MKHEALASAPVARQRPARWVSGRRARVLLCASGVSFMIMLDSNIVAVSLPSIARDLNATFALTTHSMSVRLRAVPDTGTPELLD